MTHLSSDDCARWVAGLLETSEAAAFEAHARSCPRCEAQLQREARVELQLISALAPAPVVHLPVRSKWVMVAAPLATYSSAGHRCRFGRRRFCGSLRGRS